MQNSDLGSVTAPNLRSNKSGCYVCTYTSQHPALTQHQTSKIQSENFIAKVVYQLDVVNIVSKLIETFGYLLKTCNIFSNSAMFDHMQKQHGPPDSKIQLNPSLWNMGQQVFSLNAKELKSIHGTLGWSALRILFQSIKLIRGRGRQTAPGRSATWQKHRSEGSRAQVTTYRKRLGRFSRMSTYSNTCNSFFDLIAPFKALNTSGQWRQ